MSDGAMLSLCSPSLARNWVPAAQMLAPESGRTSMLASPLRLLVWSRTVGADGSALTALTDERLVASVSFQGMDRNFIAFVSVSVANGSEMASFLTWEAFGVEGGQFWRPPWCGPFPQPRHYPRLWGAEFCLWFMLDEEGGCRDFCLVSSLILVFQWLVILLTDDPAISLTSFLAASKPRQVVIVSGRVRFCSFNSCRIVSGLFRPSMIWSLMLCCVQSSLQNWQVLASSLRLQRKSSNVSPSCCLRFRKFLRLTVVLICPSTWVLSTLMMATGSFFWLSQRPRLLTVLMVFGEKHRCRTSACVVGSSFWRPESLRYDALWSVQAMKSDHQACEPQGQVWASAPVRA